MPEPGWEAGALRDIAVGMAERPIAARTLKAWAAMEMREAPEPVTAVGPAVEMVAEETVVVVVVITNKATTGTFSQPSRSSG